MTAPAAFDPAAFIADMRAAGARLIPQSTSRGQPRRLFEVTGASPHRGIPGAVLTISEKWGKSTTSDPDWIGRVHDALLAETSEAGQ